MYFFIKYIVTLFYKKLRIKIVVSLLRESGPWQLKQSSLYILIEVEVFTICIRNDRFYTRLLACSMQNSNTRLIACCLYTYLEC